MRFALLNGYRFSNCVRTSFAKRILSVVFENRRNGVCEIRPNLILSPALTVAPGISGQ